MSEWISVKDRLPTIEEKVLAWSEYWSGIPFVGYRKNGTWYGEPILSDPDSVTHWMPLPEPPQ